MQGNPEISVVVPVYKEERNILPFLTRLRKVMDGMNVEYEVVFAADPSPDSTERIIEEEAKRDPRVKMLVFSRRFGQPAATMSGILSCSGNWCVAIDVDLQDPPELIAEMYREAVGRGCDVVYAQRRSRKGETVVKRAVAYVGYGVINRLSDVEIPRNTGDFRIMSRRVVEELRNLNETHGFLRGLVAFVGFPQHCIQYDREERLHGKGNYNRFLGSLKIGLNGIISFSTRPLFVASLIGMCLAAVSFLLGAWYAFQKFVLGVQFSAGLPTTVLVVTFFAGIQLLSLGIIGEYVGRIYDEVKKRPIAIVDRKVNL